MKEVKRDKIEGERMHTSLLDFVNFSEPLKADNYKWNVVGCAFVTTNFISKRMAYIALRSSIWAKDDLKIKNHAGRVAFNFGLNTFSSYQRDVE